ncbi:hypothetical protein TrRE_jg686, partial [Triparma retinervis]
MCRGKDSGGRPVISELSVDGVKVDFGVYMDPTYSLPANSKYKMFVHPCCALLRKGVNKYAWLEAVRGMLGQIGDESARLGVFRRMWKEGINMGWDGKGGEGRMNVSFDELWGLMKSLGQKGGEGLAICWNDVFEVENLVEDALKKGMGEAFLRELEGARKREVWKVVKEDEETGLVMG